MFSYGRKKENVRVRVCVCVRERNEGIVIVGVEERQKKRCCGEKAESACAWVGLGTVQIACPFRLG